MSDTPETDNECFIHEGDYVTDGHVPASFARKLERERDEARKECEKLREKYSCEKRTRQEIKAHRDELRAEVERLKADKSRLDWLIDCGSNEFFEALSEYSAQAREAIDAAMKGAE